MSTGRWKLASLVTHDIPLVVGLGVSLGAALPAAAHAQRAAPDTAVVHVAGSSVDAAFAAIHDPVFASDLPAGDPSRTQVVALTRRATGNAEVHEHWSDVVMVRSGRAVLRTGRALVARKANGAGEWVGTDIARPTDRPVGPGDVIVIPARVAHQWRPAAGEGFSYLVIKVRPGAAAGR